MPKPKITSPAFFIGQDGDGIISLKEEREIGRKHIRRYRRFNPALYLKLVKLARKLRGRQILHINATGQGGGVAEILKSQVSLERSLGIKSRWLAIQAPESFFKITKKIHNLLQGGRGTLSESEKKRYIAANLGLAKALEKFLKDSSPLIMVHDPQPLGAIATAPQKLPTVLRLHIDLSSPDRRTFKFLSPFFESYRKLVISNKNFQKSFPRRLRKKLAVIPPAIDPLSEKNRPLAPAAAGRILKIFGIDSARPLLVQVSRFDPWKDPLGVLEIFKRVKARVPESQLVLAGFMHAKDDPEARRIFAQVKKAARKIPDVHLFADPARLGKISNDLFINALLTAATVVLQKSKKEGFGLTVTEAMWKGKAVVASRAAGTGLQITHLKNGLLANGSNLTARSVLNLLKNKNLRRRLGQNARKSVAGRFLIPRLLFEHLKLYAACYNQQ